MELLDARLTTTTTTALMPLNDAKRTTERERERERERADEMLRPMQNDVGVWVECQQANAEMNDVDLCYRSTSPS